MWLEFPAGADANHDPRTFRVPCQERHLEAIQESIARHILLYSAFTVLGDRAGIRGPFPERAAKSLLDPILCGDAAGVNARMSGTRHSVDILIAHGANPHELLRGSFLRALANAHASSSWKLVTQFHADYPEAPVVGGGRR